jgi:hypothetical protein
LQWVPPETFTPGWASWPHRAIQASTGWANVLAEHEAIVRLGALVCGHRPEYVTFPDSDQYRNAEAAVKRAGILYSGHGGAHHVSVSDHVLYSLRYRDDTHIAHERGKHTIPAAH